MSRILRFSLVMGGFGSVGIVRVEISGTAIGEMSERVNCGDDGLECSFSRIPFGYVIMHEQYSYSDTLE